MQFDADDIVFVLVHVGKLEWDSDTYTMPTCKPHNTVISVKVLLADPYQEMEGGENFLHQCN